ncbi:Uncharacterised protein [Bordetella pertussis]|nr:Uncharacterised protein [Bordetella pertussis]CFW02179.1 Uncharacterised protein [Bordetella pertussis]CFW37431.1 Uncharacterised protein [Bordetella pertussis]
MTNPTLTAAPTSDSSSAVAPQPSHSMPPVRPICSRSKTSQYRSWSIWKLTQKPGTWLTPQAIWVSGPKRTRICCATRCQ